MYVSANGWSTILRSTVYNVHQHTLPHFNAFSKPIKSIIFIIILDIHSQKHTQQYSPHHYSLQYKNQLLIKVRCISASDRMRRHLPHCTRGNYRRRRCIISVYDDHLACAFFLLARWIICLPATEKEKILKY